MYKIVYCTFLFCHYVNIVALKLYFCYVYTRVTVLLDYAFRVFHNRGNLLEISFRKLPSPVNLSCSVSTKVSPKGKNKLNVLR